MAGYSLQSINIFSNLKNPLLGEVARLCDFREFGVGDVIFDKGERTHEVYFVLEGLVRFEHVHAKGHLQKQDEFGRLVLREEIEQPVFRKAARLLLRRIPDLRHQRPRPLRSRIRAAVIEAGKRRIRPALMTVATTILALIPVLTSTGRGSDVMVPMAIPSFGGMCFALFTVLVVPVLYSALEERKLVRRT